MTFPHRNRARQGGIAAIELAIIVCMTFFIIPLLLTFARVLWGYSVLRAATHDASRYFASAGIQDLAGAALPGFELQASQMVMEDMAAGGLEQVSSSSAVWVHCSGWQGYCGGLTEGQVTVSIMSQVTETELGAFLDSYLNPSTAAIQIPVSSTVPYASRPLDQ